MWKPCNYSSRVLKKPELSLSCVERAALTLSSGGPWAHYPRRDGPDHQVANPDQVDAFRPRDAVFSSLPAYWYCVWSGCPGRRGVAGPGRFGVVVLVGLLRARKPLLASNSTPGVRSQAAGRCVSLVRFSLWKSTASGGKAWLPTPLLDRGPPRATGMEAAGPGDPHRVVSHKPPEHAFRMVYGRSWGSRGDRWPNRGESRCRSGVGRRMILRVGS